MVDWIEAVEKEYPNYNIVGMHGSITQSARLLAA